MGVMEDHSRVKQECVDDKDNITLKYILLLKKAYSLSDRGAPLGNVYMCNDGSGCICIFLLFLLVFPLFS